MKSIGKEQAIALAETEWWKGKNPDEIVEFQLFTEELCMPFDQFHAALEASLGRPVYVHELGANYDGLIAEFQGKGSAPSMQEIVDMIPAEKRIVCTMKD